MAGSWSPPPRSADSYAPSLLSPSFVLRFRRMGLLYNACVWVGFAQDAEVPPPVGSGAGVLLEPQRALGLEEARMSGHVGAPAMDATPLLKRKGEEAPQPWLDVDGVPIPATKIRRLVRTSLSPSLSLSLSVLHHEVANVCVCVGVARTGRRCATRRIRDGRAAC